MPASAVKIANLQIEISDNSKTTVQSLTEFIDTLKSLKDATSNGAGLQSVATGLKNIKDVGSSGLNDLRKALTSSITPAEKLAHAMERIANANKALKGGSGFANAARTANNLQKQVGLPDKERNTRAGLSGGDSVTTEETNSSLERTVSMLDKVKEKFVNIGYLGKNIFANILPSSLMTLGSQFLRLAKMKIMRTIISNLMQGFTQGLQNAYQWAKATGDQFALSMDTIATSMNYAKNSIGAAFSGVLSAVAPIIDQLVDWLVKGINYVNAFFAALTGQSTYMKAKKITTAYADVGKSVGGIGGAAGGATAKVKELEEQLSVLDFDELNQLQEQQTYNPTSGGGGGGGGGGAGGSGSSAADMFERANIGNDILEKVDWLKENFDTILDIVKAIGAGILAWKLANAFSNSIRELTGLQKLGFATLVVGLTLSYEGGYRLGHDGFSVKNIVETALGVGLSAIGGALMWGAAGAVIGIAASIVVTVTGFVKGRLDLGKEIYESSEIYPIIQDSLKRAAESRQYFIDLRTKIRSLSIESDERVQKVMIAQDILNQVKQFDGLKISPDVDLDKLNSLVELFNNLDLLDVKLEWGEVNGVIKTNVEMIQQALDAYDDYIRRVAAEDLLTATYKDYYDAILEQQKAKQGQSDAADTLNMLLDNYGYTEDFSHNGNGPGHWVPGDEPNWLTGVTNPEAYAQQLAINDALTAYNEWTSTVEEGNVTIAEAEQKISELYAALGITGVTCDETGVHIDAMKQSVDEANASAEKYTKTLQGMYTIHPLSKYGGIPDWVGGGSTNALDQYLQQNKQQPVYAGMMGYQTTNTTTNQTVFTSNGLDIVTDQTRQYTNVIQDTYTAQQIETAIMRLQQQGYTDIASEIAHGTSAGKAYMDQIYGTTSAEQQNANQTIALTGITRGFSNALDLTTASSKQSGVQLNALDKYLIAVGGSANSSNRGLVLMNTGLYNIGATSKTSSNNVGLINKALNAVGVGVDYGGIASLITTNLGRQRWVDTANKMKNPVESRFNLTGNDVNYKGIYSSMSSLMLKQPFGNMGTSMKGKIEATANQTGTGFASGSIYSRISTALGKQPFGTPGTNAKNSMEKTMNQTGVGLNAKNIYSVIQKKINSQPFASLANPMKTGMEKAMNQIGNGVNVKAIYNVIAKGFDAQPWSQIGNRMGNDLRNGLQNVTNQLTDLPRTICQGMQGAANNAPFSRVGNTIGNDIKQGIRQAVQNMSFDTVAKANGVTKNVQGSIRTELYASGGYPQSGSLFVAGEAGAEAVGTIGGRTAVANREQIASAIAQALRPMVGNRNESETIQVNTYLDSQVVARANAKGVKAMNRRYNIAAKA